MSVSGNDAVRVFFVNAGAKLGLKNLTVAHGKDGYAGGGIYNGGGTLMVDKSTFSENSASISGGGILNLHGSLTATNSTFYKNTAKYGGGILNILSTLTVTSSTFSQNTASHGGGGIYDDRGTVRLSNTIVADSPSGGNCLNDNSATLTDGGYNIEDENTCGFDASSTSKADTDPKLSSRGLRNNGGPTKTIALLSSSPARNAIPKGTNGCGTEIKTDQRGVKRPQWAKCDIGAFEKKKR